MAKTIKFNLICDEKPVRTIEDLRNNFSIEDVLTYYDNKLLHRWLAVRGYDEELEAVSAITSNDSVEIIKELIRIFEVVADMEKVKECVYMLEYLAERRKQCARYEQENYKIKNIIYDYEKGYRQLVDRIIKNPSSMAIIKACIAEMVDDYAGLLELDHRNLFYVLYEKSALAVMCLLMNEKSRNYYVPMNITAKNGTIILDTVSNADKRMMFRNICSLIKRNDFVITPTLEGRVRSFSGITDGYWKDLEPKGKRCMIISMDAGDYVRPAGQSGGDLSSTDIVDKFVIVDGIDYKSNSNTRKLLYMEV